MTPGFKRRWILVLIALVAVLAGACRSDQKGDLVVGPDGDRSVDAAVLARAAEQSAVTKHRMEFFLAMSMGGEGDGEGFSFDGTTPLMTGVQDDERFRFRMDLAPMFRSVAGFGGGGLPPELASVDMVMEMAGDPSSFYLRAPMFAAFAEGGGDAGATGVNPMAAFASLGDGWGRVDLARLGEAVGDEAAVEMQKLLTGGQSYDPRQFLAMLAEVGDVEQLGTATIRGVETTGVRADVSMADLLAAQGTDPAAFLDDAASGDPTAPTPEALASMRFPIEAWTDGDGYVRRIVIAMNEETMKDVFAQLEDPQEAPGALFSMTFTVEFFDYADDSITVDFPADATDITDSFAQLLQSQP